MTQKVLPLNRTFLPVARGDQRDDSSKRLRRLWGWQPELSWGDLLRLPCAVVLGEAGTGKTTELRAMAEGLEASGQRAFFIPLEAAAVRGVEKSLDVERSRAYREWVKKPDSSEEAWLFLDSVDESKLKGHLFASALAMIGQELEPVLARVHVVLSSRVSDWRSADENEVLRLRKHLWGGEPAQAEPQVLFQLAPLAETQIEAMARHHGLSDPSTFLVAVRESNAWEFLERPLDVQWLVAYWNTHRKLGSLTELVDFNIGERLKERPDRPSVITPTRARKGASKLALAALLSQMWAFRLPGEAPDLHAGESLDPADILGDWTNDQIRDLLGRGLFDQATYGRVRIHHRNVQEFLAAEELSNMVAAGFSREDLEALLFRESAGRVVVPAALAPVLAWYAGRDRAIVKRAIETIPEHLIDEGDPSALVPEDRRDALRMYAERFREHERVFHHFDVFGLRRFACADLAESLRELLTAADSPAHLRELLLEIVEAGRITELADVALAIALDPDTPTAVRVAAIEATDKSGDATQRRALLTLIGQPYARDKDIAATLVGRLFPSCMPIDRFLDLVRVVEAPAAHEVTTFGLQLASHVAGQCNPEQRHELVRLVSDEMVAVGAPGEAVAARNDRVWLGDLLADLVTKTLSDRDVSEQVLGQALDTLELCLAHVDYLSGERTIELIRKDTELRRAFFWRRVRKFHERERRSPRAEWELRLGHGFGLDADDASWLEKDCMTRSDVRERRLAFLSLMGVAPRSPESMDAFWSSMEAVATASDAAHRTSALTKRLERSRAWQQPPQFDGHWALQSKARERRKAKLHRENLKALRELIEPLRAGERLDVLAHLQERCLGGSSQSKYEAVSIEHIAKTYDADIANAAREGFKTFWRRDDGARIETWGEPNKVPYRVIVGLAGVALDVSEGLDVTTLPEPLLRKALALCPWELNGFPEWLANCATDRPAVVRDVFAPAIRSDYARAANETGLGRLLWKLPHAAVEIQRTCAPELVDLLRSGDPLREDALSSSLRIIQTVAALAPGECASLAQTRLATMAWEDPRAFPWWSLLLAHDPLAAVHVLETSIAKTANPDAMMLVLGDQLGDRYEQKHSGNLSMLRSSPEALARLIPLVHAHVRPAEDVSHKGVFHPGPRDNAQQFRDSLIGWLSSIDDPAATAALDGLVARLGSTGAERDWLRHLVKARTVASVSKPMPPQDIGALLRTRVLQPMTERELFSVAQSRLRDIQHDLAHGDFSIREVFSSGDEKMLEEHVQNYLALELDHRRRAQYSVVREPEVARKAKPDIRLLNQRCGGPVTLELKIADRWSLPELEAAVTDQLVGTYMRANDSNYGILVVCTSGKKKGWRARAGDELDFERMIEDLRGHALKVLAATPGIVDLLVVPLDFR